MATRDAATRTLYTGSGFERRFKFTGTYTSCLAADVIPLEFGAGAISARILSAHVFGASPATTVTPTLHNAASGAAGTLRGGLSWGSTTPGLEFSAPTEAQGAVVSCDADGKVYLKPTPDATATVIVEIIAEREA